MDINTARSTLDEVTKFLEENCTSENKEDLIKSVNLGQHALIYMEVGEKLRGTMERE